MTSHRFDVAAPDAARPFRRDVTTLACYFLLAMLTLFLAMPGPLTPALMSDLGLTFTQTSFHSVFSACGMALAGATGERLVVRLGRDACVRLSLALMTGGLALICLAFVPAMSFFGAGVMGVGGGIALMCAPAAMAERHGANVGIAFGEANIIAYAGIVAAPAIVSALTVYSHWRWAVVACALATALYLLAFRRAELGAPHAVGKVVSEARLGMPYWCFWGLLMTTVSAETTLLIWTAAYFEKQLGWAREFALQASLSFPLGIVVARCLGVLLVRRFPVANMAVPSLTLATAGFLLFWSGTGQTALLGGLFVTGLGIGNMYPFGITLAVAAARGNTDLATARISLASAAAGLSAPLIVGWIADLTDLWTAMVVVPAYLALAGAVSMAGLRALKA